MKKEKIEAIIAKQLQENEELKIKIENKELRINSDIEEEFKDINNENVIVTLGKFHYRVITRFLSTNKFQSLSEANKIAIYKLWQNKQIEEENKIEKEIEEGFQEENKKIEVEKIEEVEVECNPYEESLKKGIPNEVLNKILKDCEYLDDDFSNEGLKIEISEDYLDKFAKEIANFESDGNKEIEKNWLDKWNELSFIKKKKRIENWKRYKEKEIIDIIEEKIKIQEKLKKKIEEQKL